MTDSNNNNSGLDLLETKSQFEKFVIYLPSKFFNKSTIFKSIYQCIRKKLRYKGIMTYDIDEYAKNLAQLNKYCNSINHNLITIASEYQHRPDVNLNYMIQDRFGNEFITRKFDDLDYPSANVLYIHLFGGYYYNDKIYAKKKFELERELLFFIAGNLGVGKITYTITNKETIISKIKSDVNMHRMKNQIQFVKTHSEKHSSECIEVYENNGALILFDANGDIKKLEKEIKKSLEPINSPIFNYEFYKSNPKMVAFVCKRFLFKMNTLDYTSESEDVSEMSLTVQSCFADYGLQIAFESSTTVSETVTYKLEFHKESVLLETYFQKKKYIDSASDPFVMIRKFYDEDKSINKIDSKNMIKKYIINLADKCEYRLHDSKAAVPPTQSKVCIVYTFSKKLDDFIRKSESKLTARYANFYTTRDIKKWLADTLLIRNREYVLDDFLDDVKKHEHEHEHEYEHILEKSLENNQDRPIQNESMKSIEVPDKIHETSYCMQQSALTILDSVDITAREPSPAPSLTLSENSLSSTTINAPLEPKPLLQIEYPKKESKSPEDLYIQNTTIINRYKELQKLIETETSAINCKTALLEKYKLATKDKLTEKLIELSSTQNSLHSLRSKRVMEQIKQSSCGIGLDNDRNTEPDAIGKIINMFSRKNAIINNLDKQIDKTMEKCRAIEDEVSSIKLELKNKEDEIEQLTSISNSYSDEITQLETQLLERGLALEQVQNLVAENQSNSESHLQCKSADCKDYDELDTNKTKNTNRIAKSPNKTHNRLNKFLARTFSNRSHEHSDNLGHTTISTI